MKAVIVETTGEVTAVPSAGRGTALVVFADSGKEMRGFGEGFEEMAFGRRRYPGGGRIGEDFEGLLAV